MELNETEKKTFLAKLAEFIGFSKEEEEKEKEEEKLADEPVAEEPEVKEDEKPEEDAVATLTALVADLQKQIDELVKAKDTAVTEKETALTELSEIMNKPADKKVILSAQNTATTPAALAWQRYNAK